MAKLGIATGGISAAEITNWIQSAVDRDVRNLGDSLTTNLKRKTPIDTGKARRGWRLKKLPHSFELRNDVDHIGALNEGHSKQAKRGYVERTIRSTQIK